MNVVGSGAVYLLERTMIRVSARTQNPHHLRRILEQSSANLLFYDVLYLIPTYYISFPYHVACSPLCGER